MKAEFLRSVYAIGDLPQPGAPEIAVAGKSNVGKSSLINRLVQRRQLAKTSRTPGKTRCLNYYQIIPDTRSSFMLVDLPGYGYAKVSHNMRDDWAKLIDTYLAQPDRPAGLITLFDARREPAEGDLDWLAWLAEWQRPVLVVLTKCDKLSNNEKSASLRRWTTKDHPSEMPPQPSSAETGVGVPQIWQWIDRTRKITTSKGKQGALAP